MGLSKGLCTKLETTNAFALRTLLDIPKSTSYEELLKIAGLKNLEHRRMEQAPHSCPQEYSDDQALNCIREMFFPRSSEFSLRGHFKLLLPRPNSSYMLHSFTYQTAKHWNNLPDNIRTSENINFFRRNLKRSSLECHCILCKRINL